MLEGLFHRYDDHRSWLLAVDGKTPLQVRIDADSRPAIHPEGLVRAWRQEDQPDALVLDEILQAVDPVVARPVGDEQRAAVILNLDESRFVALGRAVEPLLPSGGEDEEGRSGDEGATLRVDVVELLRNDTLDRPFIDRR